MEYRIRPEDINTERDFWNVFENMVVAMSARWLVQFAQKRGDWSDFTKTDIDELRLNYDIIRLLMKPRIYLRKNDDGSYSFTHDFIARCFLASPVVKDVI